MGGVNKMTYDEFIQKKRNEVIVYRSDFFELSDSPDWRTKHPLGPVHFQFRCVLCKEIVLTDSIECDFTDSVWSKLFPHLIEKHLNA